MYSENIGIAIKIYIPSLPQLLVPRHSSKLEDIPWYLYENQK